MAPKKADIRTDTSILNKTDNKQSQVYNQIKEDILNNTYKPGTLMVERKLCDVYNVSRSPIRNALQNLTRDGLLTFIPGKGMIVPEYTLDDILEIYNLIEDFQLYAVKSSIESMTSVSFETFKIILQSMRKSLDENDLLTCNKWDQKFHEFIVACASNHRLADFFKQLSCQNIRFISTTLNDHELAERSYNQHIKIYNGLLEKNLATVQASITEHYAQIKQYYINVLISNQVN